MYRNLLFLLFALFSLFFLDFPLAHFLASTPHFLQALAKFFSLSVTPELHISLSCTLLFASLVAQKIKINRLFLLRYSILCLSLFALCTFLKFGIGRARPLLLIQDGVFGFFFHSLSDQFRSFPSSHAAFSFAFAALLGRTRSLLLLATSLSLLRVLANKHFLSDVVVGGLIGFELALLIDRFLPLFLAKYPKLLQVRKKNRTSKLPVRSD